MKHAGYFLFVFLLLQHVVAAQGQVVRIKMFEVRLKMVKEAIAPLVLLNGEVHRIVHLFIEQGNLPHLLDVGDIVEGKAREVHLGDFLNIATVLLAEDNLLDACSFGCEYLLFDATYGEYFTTEAYLTGHGEVGFYLALCECRGQ